VRNVHLPRTQFPVILFALIVNKGHVAMTNHSTKTDFVPDAKSMLTYGQLYLQTSIAFLFLSPPNMNKIEPPRSPTLKIGCPYVCILGKMGLYLWYVVFFRLRRLILLHSPDC
jgi:hypothetical protein